MKVQINAYEFIDYFNRMDRGSQFSREALFRLFDYFEQLEDDLGESIDLDVIAICCEYSEMTLDEIIDSYSIDIDYAKDIYSQIMDYLSDRTSVVGDTENGTIIFQQF